MIHERAIFGNFTFLASRDGSTEPEVRMTAESEEDDSSDGEDEESATESDASDDTDFSPPNQPPLPPNAWNWTQGSNFQPTRLVFDATPCGFTFDLPSQGRLSALDIFKLTFLNDALQLVIRETNRYAQ